MSPVAAARTCLHCALARALRAEAPAFVERGLGLRLGRSEAVWLPVPGAVVYRGIRRLLASALAEAERSPVKLTVLALAGKSHVEVTATVLRGTRSQVLAVAFPAVDPERLAGGFSELG
jgi:hypothetical protein